VKKTPAKKPAKKPTTARARKPAARAKPTKRTPVKTARRTSAEAPSLKTPAAQLPVAPHRHRHAVFIDVENTSSEEQLFDVLDQVHIDRLTEQVQVAAVGNWRVASQRLGRRLASLGAELRHSAPATGVRDWSDLWIAVAAGYWLGRAEPGDVLEIVSNDRAFDAVGDTAALLGVTYRRLQLKRGGTAREQEEEETPAPKRRRSRGGRRRRGRGSGGGEARPTQAPAPASAAPMVQTPRPAPLAHTPRPAPTAAFDEEPHGASRDQMTSVIGRLTNGDTSRWVNLDVLEKALKAEGFARPPGSPRLVTRLRTLKEVEIDSHGRVRLRHAPAPEPEPVAAVEPEPVAAEPAPKPRARKKPATPRRRKPKAAAASTSESMDAAAPSDAPIAYGDPPLS
jgi:hypothetical protein